MVISVSEGKFTYDKINPKLNIILLIIVKILNTYTSIHMVKQSISLQHKLGFNSLISAKTFDTVIPCYYGVLLVPEGIYWTKSSFNFNIFA